MKTLLLDDEPFALKILAHQLAGLGCTELVSCEHAREALAMLEIEQHDITLLFCDLQMPDLDGVEFVRHLARLGYAGSLVLISGEDERVVRTAHKLAEAHHIDVLGSVSKPVPVEMLRQLLARHAARGTSTARLPAAAPSADELATALNQGQLLLHYQPKVDLTTAALVGVEALVRWQHPHAGLVYPDQFIDLAEDNALIDRLTQAVLAAALAQSRRWTDDGLDLQMSVNVSMDNLADLQFPDTVARMAGEAGVALSQLQLEVTESRLMKDLRAPLDILTRLRLKRIGLSIDDFGTGHSSLAQLRDVPFDELKLDRSFIRGAATDQRLGAIVSGTLAMARQLGIKTVAEGVEERGDWDYLSALGCDIAQGYFVARPMPGTALPAWRDAWEARRAELTTPAGSLRPRLA